MKRFSKPWKALLLAVPMLVCSMSGQASEHWIEFGTPSATNSTEGVILNANDAPSCTYRIIGSVSNLQYNTGNNDYGLNFDIDPVEGSESSLTLTSLQSFFGTLRRIVVECSKANGLVIEAYAGQRYLGMLNSVQGQVANTSRYVLSLESLNMLSGTISLKFRLDKGVDYSVNVSKLTKAVVSLDERSFDVPVTFDPKDLEGLDEELSNYLYKGILLTLNTSVDGEGFDSVGEGEEKEGFICNVSTLTDAAVASLHNNVKNHNYHPGDQGYAIDFSGGITTMIARGKGYFELEALTESNYAYHVKIGDAAPVEFVYTNRQTLSVPYNVDKDTYVYIYLVDKSPSSSRSGTRIGRRGTAHGIVYTVKCSTAPIEKTDVGVYVDYIMGRDEFIFHNADLNGDYKINVADIVDVLNIE